MELRVFITFTAEAKDKPFWTELVKGLADNKQGAWLEEQFEYFDNTVTEGLEALLDLKDRSGETVFFEGGQCRKLDVIICMIGGYGILNCIPKIKAFFELCPVSNLKVTPEPEEYTSCYVR